MAVARGPCCLARSERPSNQVLRARETPNAHETPKPKHLYLYLCLYLDL